MKMFKYNIVLFLIGLFKIPMLLLASPRIVFLDEKTCRLKIKLGYWTKNHLNSMYFGVLAVGAELSIGIPVVFHLKNTRYKVNLVFKDFNVQYLKRADGHVIFSTDEVTDIIKLVEQANNTPDRVEKTYNGYACLESKPDEKIAVYKITLSMKKSAKAAI